MEDILFLGVLGVVLGGRLGYCLFYKPAYYAAHPLEIFYVWQGGMSFHGGMLGVIASQWWFAHSRGRAFLQVMDFIAPCVPTGLASGRVGNFINGELWGRETSVPWGMVFPGGGDVVRHPSQLYQAGLEGLLLGLILSWFFWKTDARYKPGYLAGQFLLWMGVFRFVSETVREPDVGVYGLFGMTMGQTLCVPLIALGLYLIFTAKGRRERVESIAGQQSVA